MGRFSTPAAAFLLVAFAACASPHLGTEPQAISRPIVERLAPEEIRLRWPATFSNGSAVTVYAGLDPGAIDRSRELARVTGTSVEFEASNGLPEMGRKTRLYFELEPGDGPPTITAERRLPLQGPDNFRDLGGYATSDGRAVRWGRLYRSNDLSTLTRDDLAYLANIDVKLVCDFRSDAERTRKPNKVLGPDPAEQLHLSVEQKGADPTTVQHSIRTGGITALAAEQTMLAAYRAFVTDHTAAWSAMFQRLVRSENYPTVVHCTAGKDRTGFASALVLLSLGVPEGTVFEDYLSTNRYRDDYFRRVFRWLPLYSLFRTKPESLAPILEARAEYLQASLEEIEDGYGSVDDYLSQALGLTPAMRASLRRNLLR